jgi:TP901 family phage tail tape measure protein
MSDVNANIGVHIDTSSALAELKNLQRQLANFHASIAKTSAAATMAQKGLQNNLLNSINATGQFSATMGTVRSSTESFTHALESNKLSMREYFRYAGGSSKTFGRLFRQEFDTIGKVAEDRVKKMQTQYIKMGRDASGAIKAMAITPQTLNMNDYATKTALAAQKQALFNQVVRQGSTSLLNFGKNTQWAGRQLMVGFTIPLAYFGTTASKVFMDLEAQAIKFKRVYGDMFTTADETNKALAEVEKLAEGFTKYGVAVSKTMEMAAAAAAMGKTGADLTAQVSEATRLAVLGGVEQEQALETTISLTNAFGIAAEDLASKINFLNSVENQTVVSIEDLTIAIPKAGPVVQQLGGDVEDLAFFLTAMKEGGINASEGANALKSGLASLINPSTKASKMLAELGINIKAIVEGNDGNVRQTVIDFSKALDTLDPLNRARAIEQLFGKFQFSRLSTLFQNVTKEGTQASKVLKMAGASIEELAILSERELKTVENSVGVQFKSAVEELKLAIAPIGKTFLEAVTPIIKTIGGLLDKFNNLGDGTKKFIVIASTLVGIIGPTLLMTFGLLANGVANIIKLFLALRGGFLRLGGNSKILAEQTNYLNAEQLESATVAASLNQAHTRLTQSFTAETSAVRALRQAYIEATLAAANFARANPGMMMPGGAKVPKKFSRGATYVPGTGNKDTVPSMLTPGEAVIPKRVAQDPRFQPIIDAMVNGNLQGFSEGSVSVGSKSFKTSSQKTARDLEKTIAELISKGIPEEKIVRALERNIERGRPMNASQLKRRLSIGRGSSSGSSAPSSIRTLAKQSQSGFLQETEAVKKALKEQGVVLTPAQEKNLFNVQASHIDEARTGGVKEWKANNLVADLGYVNNYINTVKGKLGTDLLKMTDARLQELGIDRKELQKLQAGTHPTTADAAKTLRAVAQYDSIRNPASYQAKAVVAGLEHRSRTGFYAQPMKTLAETQPVSSRAERAIKSRVDLIEQEKNARAGNDSQQIMKQIDRDIRRSALGKQSPTNFGTQISPTTGHSFPVKGLGGVYQKPDGTLAFVKPVIDAKAALAEQRATIIARDVHGLDAPEQQIRTMLDPTDPTGKRKLIVLESPFDPRFDPSKMTGKFTKDQYFRQLVAANLRGDKDLGRGNLSGNVLADVGTAGVFEKASGKRDFAKTMPSMAEQAKINLLGVKGGAKRFFAESTLDIPRGMTADEYHSRMIKEIDKVLPKLRDTLSRLDLTPAEKTVYSGMVARLEEGRKVNWREFHKMHSSALVTKKEALQDKKTGDITAIKGKPKPKRAVSSSGKISDSVITQIPPGKTVVQKPKGFISSRIAGKFMLPGYAKAPTAAGATIGDISQSQRLSRAQILAATEKISLNQAKKKIAAEAKLIAAMKETTEAQKTTKEKLTNFSNKANLGMGAMSGLTIAASFAGGRLGEVANTLMPFVFGLQGIVLLLPLLANPWVAAIAAIAAVGGMMWKLARDVENARKEGVNLAKAMSMTSEKLQSLSSITGTVSATEAADRKRQNTLTGESAVQRKVGQNILGSDFGKGLLADIEKQAKSGQGIQEIGRNISTSLSYAIIQGVITTDQAKSIASALGEELKSYEIPAVISGRLVKLFGPNGENLATDPLKITLEIQEESMTRQADFFKTALEQSVSTITFTNLGNVVTGGVMAAIGGTMAVAGVPAFAAGGVPGVGLMASGTALTAAGTAKVASGFSDQNQRREVNANLGAAALQLGLEQVVLNNGLVDSLNKQYEIKLKMAQTDAEIKKIEDERAAAIDALNAKNTEALNLLISQKDAFGPEIFTKGINAAIDALYPTGPLKVFADEAKKELEGIKDADFKALLQVQFAGGALDPVTIMKLANNQELQSKFTVMVEQQGSEQANLVMQLLMKAGTDETNLPIFMDILNKDKKNFDKNLDAISVLANMQQKYGITIDVNDDGVTQIKEVVAVTDKLKGIKNEELSKEAFFDLGITGDMTGPDFDKLWTTLVGTANTINKKVVIDFVASQDKNVVDQYMAAMGITAPKGRLGAMLRKSLEPKAAAWNTGRQGKVTVDPDPTEETDVTTTGRNTVFDSILQDLKNTRNATINAMGGAKELMRILGGKKDIQLFNGIDQQLSKLGANSDFIDFVGGLENAVKEKIIKINKQGVVSYGEFGEAAKKAFDEKQLGAFSSKSAIAIKELQGQRSGFVALRAAGVETADAVEMVADATFMVSLAAQKNPEEIKRMTDEWKIMKREMDLTTAATNPQEYFNDQMAIAERQLSHQEEMARRTYEPQIEATEKLVKANNILIEQAQRKLELDATYGSRQIDKINAEIDALNRQIATGIDATIQALSEESAKLSEDQATIAKTVDAINEKYDLQEEALSKISDLNKDIIDEKKTQISLADALTRGDISAAAQAAEDMRSASASRALSSASDAISSARGFEVDAVTGSITGKNSSAITERQYQIDRETYRLGVERAKTEALIAAKQEEIYKIDLLRKPILAEITRLEDLNYNYLNNEIPLLRSKLDQELSAIDAQREKWTTAQLAIDSANLSTETFKGKLEKAESFVDSIAKLWGKITDKDVKITIQTIEEVIKQQASFVKAGTVTTQSGAVIAVDANGRAADGSVPISKSSETSGTTLVPVPNFTPYLDPPKNTLSPGDKGFVGPVAPEPPIVTPKATTNSARRLMPLERLALAKGGMVPNNFIAGEYAQGTDTVPAMLTPGEYVLRRDAVKKYGVKQLDAMNVGYYDKGGEVSKFASRPKYGIKSNPEEKGIGSFFKKSDRDKWTAESKYNSFLSTHARKLAERDKRIQEMLNKSPLTSWMGAEGLGTSGLLKSMTGQGTKSDKVMAALFPLNFMGMGKFTKEGSKAIKPVSSGVEELGSKILKDNLVTKISSMLPKISAPAGKFMGTLKKIINLPQTRRAEIIAAEAAEARKTAEAVEFLKNNPPASRPTGPGAPPSLWDGVDDSSGMPDDFWTSIDDAPVDPNSFFMQNALQQKPPSALRKTLGKIGSTVAKPVTVPAKLLARAAKIGKNSWDVGQSSFRWAGDFDYYGRTTLMREIASRTIGKLAEKVNPKVTMGLKFDQFHAGKAKSILDLISPLQTYMRPLDDTTIGLRFGLKYRNIPKNILEKNIKPPVMKALSSATELKNSVKNKFTTIKDKITPDILSTDNRLFNYLYSSTPVGGLIARGAAARLGFKKTEKVNKSGLELSMEKLLEQAFYHGGNLPGKIKNRFPVPNPMDNSNYVPANRTSNWFAHDFFATVGIPQAQQYAITKNAEGMAEGASDIFRTFFNLDKSKTWDMRPGFKSLYSQNPEAYRLLESYIAKTRGIKAAREFLLGERVAGTAMGKMEGFGGTPFERGTQGATPFTGLNLGDVLAKTVDGVPTRVIDSIIHKGGIGNWGLPENPHTVIATMNPKTVTQNLTKLFPRELVASTIGAPEEMIPSIMERMLDQVAKTGKATPLLAQGHVGRRVISGPTDRIAMASGGLVPRYLSNGGYAVGTDTVPAMLTPGEFVINRIATKKFGPMLNDINNLQYPSMMQDLSPATYKNTRSSTVVPAVNTMSTSVSDNSRTMYNYGISVNVSNSNASTDDIARAVITQIRNIDGQRIRGQR